MKNRYTEVTGMPGALTPIAKVVFSVIGEANCYTLYQHDTYQHDGSRVRTYVWSDATEDELNASYSEPGTAPVMLDDKGNCTNAVIDGYYSVDYQEFPSFAAFNRLLEISAAQWLIDGGDLRFNCAFKTQLKFIG